ncbi:membrane protein insertase YidC [Actinotalea sp. JY-7885]|uniref:membrane protein insertase YidC n=1 Tax=unclassified Actinotalea TaxID=2638618 RepID=UPI0015F5A60A|nr:membrane protein insertase YidC [Actinotalea sp. JY-7885]
MPFPDNILWPLKVAVAWIMVQFHSLLTAAGLDPASGAAWALSIVGLVIVIRILLIPLFVRQIKASRGMQALAPEMQAIQKKYKGKTDPASREAMSRETMELYRKHGTNPFASCLPILAQSPIFFALFRVLYSLPALEAGTYGDGRDSIGPLTQELAAEANNATLFGAKISETFLGSDDVSVKIVTVLLIVAMSATTFFTQRQLTQKNMPASALQGPMAQQQKMLLYLLPVVFAVSGVNFPIGVLIYWTTTNVWSMGQQFYVIRRNPTPGSEADRLLKERRARKAAAKGIVLEEPKAEVEEKPRGQRPQPKRKARAKPVAGAPTIPAGTSDAPQDDVQDTPGGMLEVQDDAPAPTTPAAKKRPATSAGGATKPRPAGATGGTTKPRPAGATGGTTKPAAAGGTGTSAAPKKPRPGGATGADGAGSSTPRKPRTPKK